MGRLIDEDDVLKVLCHELCHPGAGCPDGYCEEMREKLKDVPTVDAVPVVRCKECKYGEQDDYGWICTNIDGGIMGDENGNGFCCEGERREE